MKNLEQSGQIPSEISSLETLELKANLNPEQRAYLEVLKDKMKKILGNKTKQELAKAGDLVSLKNYKVVLTEILSFLRTKEMMEHKFELKKQYDQQFEILKETGVIKELSDGSWGMLDILGREQTIPGYEEIRERMEAKAEMLDKKRKQGFTKLLLVPVGMSLRELADIASQLIVKKRREGEVIFGADGKKQLIEELLPVNIMSSYEFADINGKLIYYPENFTPKHGGKTKKELIEKNGGWQIELIEDLPDLPRNGHGRNLGGRKQPESFNSAKQYLKLIQTENQYQGEQITIPEDSLTYFMNYLFMHNRVIDDKYVNRTGVAPINAGAFFDGDFAVPCTFWSNISGDYHLGGTRYNFKGEDSGVRTTVII